MKNEYGRSSPFTPSFPSSPNVTYIFILQSHFDHSPFLALSPACSHLVHIRMDGGEMEEEEAEEGRTTNGAIHSGVCKLEQLFEISVPVNSETKISFT